MYTKINFFLDAVRWYFKENKKMFRDMLDEKVVFKSLFFQNIYDPSKDERRLKKLEREAAQRKAAEEAQEERRRRALLLAEGSAEGDGEEILEAYDEDEMDEEEEVIVIYKLMIFINDYLRKKS